MKRTLVLLLGTLVIASMLLLGAACGGDDGDDGDDGSTSESTQPAPTMPAEPSDSNDDDGDQSDAEPVSGSGDGVIQLNGETIEVMEVLRCEPFSDGEENVDLQASGAGIRLFVVVNATGTSLSHELSLQGSNAGGVFSATANRSPDGSWIDENGAVISEGAPFTVSGDRISGSMTLNDARGGDATADVSFDISIPSEIQDCSL